MAYVNVNLNQVLTQCQYDQPTKNYLYQEQMHLLQIYQLSHKAVNAKLSIGSFIILEANGTIPVFFNNNTYNIPIKIHYLPGYPKSAPVLLLNPSADMIIKPSEFVNADGIATLEIMRQWNPRLTTVQMLEEAKKAFSVKMPLYKRQKNPAELQQSASYNSLPRPDPRVSGPASVYPNPDPYFNLSRAPTEVFDPRYASVNPSNLQKIPEPARKPEITPETLKTVKEKYIERVKELNSEIAVLKNEAGVLQNNKKTIDLAVDNFKREVQNGQNKKDLLEASIKNTEEWLANCCNSATLDVSERELLEYRSEDVKAYLDLYSQEKTMESITIAVVDSINKSVIPAKDGLMSLKQLYIDLFLLMRLKEKAEKIVKTSN